MSVPQQPITFTTGGTMEAGDWSYISRRADDELLTLCRQGAFAYILTARQMGKSSLMVRTAVRLKEENIRSVIIDLSGIGAKGVTPEQWYLGLLEMIETQLGISTDVVAWWQNQAHLSVTHRLTKFLQEVLLRDITDPIVIFVDEIDTTLRLEFTDDFFAAIRSYYNSRATAPEFHRLSFVLIGVATPGDLINDSQRTPFNIGQRVDLTDFTHEEVLPLAKGLSLSTAELSPALDRVLHWTNGHPYLTQRLCQALGNERRSHWSAADVDRAVEQTFFGAKSEQDNNLQFVRDMLTKRADDVEGALTTYRDARSGKRPVPDEERSLVKSHLKLSGIVRRDNGNLLVRNRIYETVFDDNWVKKHLRVDLVKRVRRVSVKLIPYAAIIVILLSLYGWLTVWSLNDQANIARDRLKVADDANRLAKSELEQSKKDREIVQRQVEFAKTEAKTAKENAAKQQEITDRVIKDAQFQLRNVQEKLANANAITATLQLEATNAKNAAESARAGALQAEAKRKAAEMATAEAVELASKAKIETEQAKKDTEFAVAKREEALQSLKEADEEIKQVIESRRREDEKARKESFSKSILRSHTGPLTSVALSPQRDSNLIVTASEDGTARVLDREKLGKDAEVSTLKTQAPLKNATFSSDGQLVVTANEIGKIRVYDSKTGGEVANITGSIGNAPFNAIQQWRVSNRSTGDSIATPLAINSNFVATEGLEPGTLRYLDLTDLTKAPVIFRGHQGELSGLAVSPDGKFVVAANKDYTIQVWRKNTPDKVFAVFLGHQAPLTSLAFSPDENLLATASEDKTARVWNLIDPEKKPVVMNRHREPLTSIAFSPSGKLVVTASHDGRTRVWNATNGKNIAELRKRTFLSVVRAQNRRFLLKLILPISVDFYSKGELPVINSAAFSPDGNYVVTSSEDGTAQIWKAEAGKSVATLNGHILAVRSAVFTPDGMSIITAGADNTVRVWDLCGGKVKLRSSQLRDRCPTSDPASAPD